MTTLALAPPRAPSLRRAWRVAERIASTVSTAALAAGGSTLAPRGRHGLAARADLARGVFADLCDTHGVQVAVEGPLPSPGSIVVANHVSYLDPIVLGSLFPCAAIAKAEVRGWPFVGSVGAGLGTLFVQRGDAMSGALALRAAARCLAAGVSVLAFPEGTTTEGDRVLPFRRGVFGLAKRLGVPVVPVHVRHRYEDAAWTGDASFAPHYLGLAGRERLPVTVSFGAPLRPGRLDRADATARLAHFVVSRELGGLS